jgi:hypothetical protein
MFFFLSKKSEDRRAEQVLGARRVGTGGRGKVAEEEDRRVNTMQKMHTHVCKGKNGIC